MTEKELREEKDKDQDATRRPEDPDDVAGEEPDAEEETDAEEGTDADEEEKDGGKGQGRKTDVGRKPEDQRGQPDPKDRSSAV